MAFGVMLRLPPSGHLALARLLASLPQVTAYLAVVPNIS